MVIVSFEEWRIVLTLCQFGAYIFILYLLCSIFDYSTLLFSEICCSDMQYFVHLVEEFTSNHLYIVRTLISFCVNFPFSLMRAIFHVNSSLMLLVSVVFKVQCFASVAPVTLMYGCGLLSCCSQHFPLSWFSGKPYVARVSR